MGAVWEEAERANEADAGAQEKTRKKVRKSLKKGLTSGMRCDIIIKSPQNGDSA